MIPPPFEMKESVVDSGQLFAYKAVIRGIFVIHTEALLVKIELV
jgi:hypothetical protein